MAVAEPVVRSVILSPDLAEVARARAWIAEIASKAGFAEARVFDITVACSEAIANAIEHSPAKDEIQVRAVLHPDRLEVEVEGPGEFQAPDRQKERNNRGMGLPLMARLSDHLALYSGSRGGTLVALTFYLPAATVEERIAPPGIEEACLAPASQARRVPIRAAGLEGAATGALTDAPLSSYDRLSRYAWLAVPLLLALITALWLADLRTAYESRVAMVALNVCFSWLAALCICILAGRGFMRGRQVGLLMFGCGSLIWGASSLAAATVIGAANTTVTIHNIGVLAAGLCYVLGLLWRGRTLKRAGRWLVLGYAGALAVSAGIFGAVEAGLTPTFFVQGDGGTPIRQLVLLVAVGCFAAVAWRILYSFWGLPGTFYYWYGLGLALFAAGLTGVILLTVQGGILGWTNRLTQYLGSAYLLVAAFKAARGKGEWSFSSEAVAQAWQEPLFLAGLRQRSAFGWVLRYGLVVIVVAAANWLYGALTAHVGTDLPLFITFYPAVMVAAVLAGFGPGILATAAAAFTVAIWYVPPRGEFYVALPADRLSLLVFTAMGLTMSVVSALYHRGRLKAAADSAAHESRARLAAFAEATFEGIIESQDGWIVDCNDQLARMLGYSPDELKGKEVAELVVPEDRRRVTAAFGEEHEASIEHAMVRKNGSLIEIEAHSRSLPGSLRRHIAIRDITARKKAEEDLHQSEERSRALAEQNRRLYRQQLDIAENLQHAILNIPSDVGAVRLGHLYRSATEAARVGGDFYDVFRIKNGNIVLLVGDVSGHGIEAARTATLVKDVVHAFIHQSTQPHEVVKQTNALLVEKDLPGFVTLFLGILDAETGTFRYTSAGHPETLLRRVSGEIQLLGSSSYPVGVYEDASWKSGVVQVEPGDLLLLYTDGVLEARHNGNFFGLERLESIVRSTRLSVEQLPHRVLDEVLAFSGGKLRDDLAVLAVLIAEKTGRKRGAETGAKGGAEAGAEPGANHGGNHGANHGGNHGANHGIEAGAQNGAETGATLGAKPGAKGGAKPGAKPGGNHTVRATAL